MDKILQKRFEFNKKTRISLGLSILAFVLLSLLIFQVLNIQVENSVKGDAEKNIKNISSQNADAIYRELFNRQMLLTAVAEGLDTDDVAAGDWRRILKTLEGCAKKYHFYNMGVLTLDGVLYTTTGREVDVGNFSPYREALDKEPLISESFLAADGGGVQLNAFTMPVTKGDEILFILTATYQSSNLAEDLNLKIAEGEGFSFILNAEGRAVIYPHNGENQEYVRLLNFVDEDKDLTPRGEEKEERFFEYEGEGYYAHFEALGINDWYLMTCAKTSDVYAGMHVIMRNVYIGMGFLWAMILAILGAMMGMYRRQQEKIQDAVFLDPLLKENNFDYLRLYFSQIPRENRRKMALMVLDVNNFKIFNMLYGSRKGDELLRYIDRVFKKTLPEDRLYRHVSDQFAGLLSCGSREEAEKKIRRLLNQIDEDIEEKRIITFVPSVGVCMLGDYHNINVAYSDAMIAKNTIKGNNIVKYAFYDEIMRKSSQRRMKLEAAFQEALRAQEFHIYYQPKYDIRSGSIVGAEALVRWIPLGGGMITPGDFIPCFEQSGQIVLLDEAVLDRVCREIREMEEEGLEIPRVSVNLSRVHLKEAGIVDKIRAKLKELDICPKRLSFEITESALYDDNISLSEIVSGLHKLGCRVDMDDYGTGISSLNSLANIEFDVIKLDKSFIDGVGNSKMESVIRSTIRLSEELGMTMIAEGVETKEQADFLVKWGCHYAQGFYYSMPVTKDAYKEMLRKRG